MRPSLRFLPLILGALLASVDHAPARAANDSASASIHLDDASLPDPTKSPGDFSRDLAAADLCDTPSEEFASSPPKALCDEAFEEARVSADYKFQYACVFLVPPAIGGTQSRANIWLQPAAEASLKATADAAARKDICRSPGDLAEAQRLLAINWVGAYRKYLLPGDKLLPIAKEERGPDTFGLLPPAPAEEGGASGDTSFGGAYEEPGYGYGGGGGGGDSGGGGAGSNDRRDRQQRSSGDDRRGADRRGVGGRGVGGRGTGERRANAGRVGDHQADDQRGSRLRDRDGRRQNEAGRDGARPSDRRSEDGRRRDDVGRDGMGPHPEVSQGGARLEDGRRDDGRHDDGRHDDGGRRDGADRGRDGVGWRPETPRDGLPSRDGRSDDGRGMHSHDWPHDHRDGRDFGPSGGDRDPYHHPAGPREIDPRRPSDGERSAGWPDRPSTFPQGSDAGGFGSNHPLDQDRRVPSRYDRGQDVRPNDIRPNDVRPNNVRPNDIRPNNVRPNNIRPLRPGLGRPRYPGGPHRFGGRGGGRRR